MSQSLTALATSLLLLSSVGCTAEDDVSQSADCSDGACDEADKNETIRALHFDRLVDCRNEIDLYDNGKTPIQENVEIIDGLWRPMLLWHSNLPKTVSDTDTVLGGFFVMNHEGASFYEATLTFVDGSQRFAVPLDPEKDGADWLYLEIDLTDTIGGSHFYPHWPSNTREDLESFTKIEASHVFPSNAMPNDAAYELAQYYVRASQRLPRVYLNGYYERFLYDGVFANSSDRQAILDSLDSNAVTKLQIDEILNGCMGTGVGFNFGSMNDTLDNRLRVLKNVMEQLPELPR